MSSDTTTTTSDTTTPFKMTNRAYRMCTSFPEPIACTFDATAPRDVGIKINVGDHGYKSGRIVVNEDHSITLAKGVYIDELVRFCLEIVKSHPDLKYDAHYLAKFVAAADQVADKRHGYSFSPEERDLNVDHKEFVESFSME